MWPMDYKHLTDDIIYKANVTSNLRQYNEHIYFGSTEPTFKKGYGNRKKSLNLVKYKNVTELPNENWRIKRLNGRPEIKWTIVKKCDLNDAAYV